MRLHLFADIATVADNAKFKTKANLVFCNRTVSSKLLGTFEIQSKSIVARIENDDPFLVKIFSADYFALLQDEEQLEQALNEFERDYQKVAKTTDFLNLRGAR